MNLSKLELELKILAQVSRNSKNMDKLLSRQITKEHFDSIEDGEKHSYTNALFKLIHNYWSASGGSLFTTFVLESKLNEKKVSEKVRAKIFSVWTEIQDLDIDENDFFELTSQLKEARCHQLLSGMLSDINEKYNESGLDSTVKVIQDSLEAIQQEKNEIGADRHNFDVNESSDYFKAEFDKRVNHPELFRGIECGVSNIDTKTFGWLPGQIIVFLAPS
jgi:replicative DNA helicase